MTNFARLKKLSQKVRDEVVKTRVYDVNTLQGGCGTASYHLMRCAKKNNINVRFVYGLFTRECGVSSHHAWVEYGGHVFDLTKRQFDDYDEKSPRVAVIPISKAKQYFHHKANLRTPLVREAYDWINSWAIYPESLENNLITIP